MCVSRSWFLRMKMLKHMQKIGLLTMDGLWHVGR